MNNLKGKKLAIIGTGPGGLVLARLLQQKGVQLTVFERDAHREIRQQGATLDLHVDSGLKAIKAAGLLPAFKAAYRPGADRIRITDMDGHILMDEHQAATSLSRQQADDFDDPYFRPEIDRGPLRDLLIDSLEEGTIVWDRQLIAMEPLKEGWLIRFKDGSTYEADVVIGADGMRSVTRKSLTSIAPVYSGISILEGYIPDAASQVPELNALVKGGKVFALGLGQSLMLGAKGDGSLSFCIGTRENEGWPDNTGIDFTKQEQVLPWFRQHFPRWSQVWWPLFQTDRFRCVPRPMFYFPLDQHWASRPDLTIIGDAAHGMPPYAGEGANMAMLDALELADCLTDPSFKQTGEAIAFFEKKMLQRAAASTKDTMDQTNALHSPGGLRYLLEMFGGNR